MQRLPFTPAGPFCMKTLLTYNNKENPIMIEEQKVLWRISKPSFCAAIALRAYSTAQLYIIWHINFSINLSSLLQNLQFYITTMHLPFLQFKSITHAYMMGAGKERKKEHKCFVSKESISVIQNIPRQNTRNQTITTVKDITTRKH